ncbi:MAG: DUF2802 domain-containing protein [Firmicutes bacterium]|nr:DUF2802 domain-containing protein [Bacillota bacterium]
MGYNLVWLGFILGCVAGFFIAGWFSRKHPPLETFFLRLLNLENRSMRTDTRVMLHELHQKVENLSAKMQRMDAQLQDLLAAKREKAISASSFLVNPEQKEGFNTSDRFAEIASLTKEGFSADEIAQRLNLGRGEVELILSLGKKPSWVAGSNLDS